jgi:hypothetical protein
MKKVNVASQKSTLKVNASQRSTMEKSTLVNSQSQRSMFELTINDRANVAVMWSRVDVALPKGDTWHCAERLAHVAREKEADGAGTLGGG